MTIDCDHASVGIYYCSSRRLTLKGACVMDATLINCIVRSKHLTPGGGRACSLAAARFGARQVTSWRGRNLPYPSPRPDTRYSGSPDPRGRRHMPVTVSAASLGIGAAAYPASSASGARRVYIMYAG